MLYTGKGDDGTTKLFACDQRKSKSSESAEALGSLDELNSFLGLVRVKDSDQSLKIGDRSAADILLEIQNALFIIQAEVAGANKRIGEGATKELEKAIALIEKEIPPVDSFKISGGTELSALCDVARTLARKAERRVVALSESEKNSISSATLSYMNRLSSFLYALARLMNSQAGVKEKSPWYN